MPSLISGEPTRTFPDEVVSHTFHGQSPWNATRYRKVQKNRMPVSYPAQGKFTRRSPVSLPEPVNMDVLAAMSDEELNTHLRSINEVMDTVYEHRIDARSWEEEIAYVRREQQIRRARRESHEKYVRQLEREFTESEAGLPVADLDNSAFLEFNR